MLSVSKEHRQGVQRQKDLCGLAGEICPGRGEGLMQGGSVVVLRPIVRRGTDRRGENRKGEKGRGILCQEL